MGKGAQRILTIFSKRYTKANSLHSLSLLLSIRQTVENRVEFGCQPRRPYNVYATASHRLLVYRKHSQHSSSLCPIAAIPSYLALRCAMAQYDKSQIICINTRNSLTRSRSLSAANTTAIWSTTEAKADSSDGRSFILRLTSHKQQ